MGGVFRAEPEARRGEARLEYRFEDYLRRRHHHPIADCGNAERTSLARFARLWYAHPPQRLGPVSPGPQLGGEGIEERTHPGTLVVLDQRDCHAVDARGAFIGGHGDPCPPHHIATSELVVKSMESTLWVLLGTAVEHSLQGANRVQTIGLSDGPSRLLGTHQCSSLFPRAPVK
jgi:hypothetical protein